MRVQELDRGGGWVRSGLLALPLSCLWLQQTAAQATSPAQTATAPVSRTLQGQVVNALTGGGVPRALVTIGSRSVLSDAQGAFLLPEYTGQSALARIQKPGFSSTLNQEDLQSAMVVDLDEPIRLVLYPDGLITGTVTGAEGEPLDRIPVTIERAQYDLTGLHPVNSGMAMTDSHGQFRFREPPGRYRLSIRFTPRLDSMNQAVLPQSIPQESSSTDAGYVQLGAGEQKVYQMRPAVGQTYNVGLRVDGADVQFGMQITATDSAGETFSVGSQPVSGELRVALPSGSYLLRAVSQVRDQTVEAIAKVSVAGHDVHEIPMHLTAAAVLPLEFSMDLSTAATSLSGQITNVSVNPQNLNLTLHSAAVGEDVRGNDIRLSGRSDGSFEFRVPSGRYHLRGNSNGAWSVESATYGQTNLLAGEVVIGSGSGGATVRIVATNRSGKVNGTVQPAAGAPSGTVPQGWVYLIAQFPSLTPFTRLRISRSGTWATTLPPGSYTALAVLHSIEADLSSNEVATRLARLGRTVEITDGGQVSLDLAVSDPDLKETP